MPQVACRSAVVAGLGFGFRRRLHDGTEGLELRSSDGGVLLVVVERSEGAKGTEVILDCLELQEQEEQHERSKEEREKERLA